MTAIDPELVGSVITHVGTPGFADALDQAMRRVAPFDLSAIFVYPDGQRPELLHDGLRGVSSPAVMQAYLEGTYLLDAVYTACKMQHDEGLFRLIELAPDAFFETEYYNSPHLHPCISMESGALAEEIAFIVRFTSGTFGAYSLLRENGSAPFSPAEFDALAAYFPVVHSALRRNWSVEPTAPAPSPRQDGMETEFQTFAVSVLSPREQHIVSLILRGHSTVSISLVLGIAEGTVKNHRKHIHAKLGISSQAELFALFLEHVRAMRSA